MAALGRNGLLEQIFSNLDAKDLRTATMVCTEWKDVADKFLDKSRKIQSFYMDNDLVSFNLNKQAEVSTILLLAGRTSMIIIDKMFTWVNQNEFRKRLSERLKLPDMDSIHFLSLISTRTFVCSVKDGILQPEPENMDDSIFLLGGEDEDLQFLAPCLCSLLVIPKYPGLTIKCEMFTENETDLKPQIETFSDAKALLILTHCRCVPEDSLDTLMDGLLESVQNQGYSPPCIVGSILYRVLSKNLHTVRGFVVLSFIGDNITAHSRMHEKDDQNEQFWVEFVDAVGPQPPDSTRFAFIIEQSLNGDDTPIRKFAKNFPGLPYYGVGGFGMLCFPGGSPVDVDNKKDHLNQFETYVGKRQYKGFNYKPATAYLILTVKHS